MERAEKRNIFLWNFIKCGIAGWCLEIIFTSIESIAAGDLRLMGRTSLIMFPIYGMGALLRPIGRWLDRWLGDFRTLRHRDQIWRHGMNDMVLIFFVEYVTGAFLRHAGICPWDYSGRYFGIDGLIRLDFAPCWFLAGLLFEQIAAPRPMPHPPLYRE